MSLFEITKKLDAPFFFLARANGILGGLFYHYQDAEGFTLGSVEEADITEYQFFNDTETYSGYRRGNKWQHIHINDMQDAKHIDRLCLMEPIFSKIGGYPENDNMAFIKRTYLKIHPEGHHYEPVAERYIGVTKMSVK
ncbi:hypothetical protein [Jiulongibacter sediminis]|mgnify:CR=1 FL=1|uniref:hypothetical protein n=1 Tax=Jiulongibacter sediminis TaxID=1605367 RepID=UPI0026EE610D|nr:hypothetical protein [Jiulongibacter sediminis]